MIFNIMAGILAADYIQSEYYIPPGNKYDREISVTDWILHQSPPISLLWQVEILKVLPKMEELEKKYKVNNMNNKNTEANKVVRTGHQKGVLESSGIKPSAEIGAHPEILADKFIDQIGYKKLKNMSCNEFEDLVTGFVYIEKEHESKIGEVIYFVFKKLKKMKIEGGY